MSNIKTDLQTINAIHFIGIGGIGISALARFFLHEKKSVSGSDRAASAITDALVREGVKFFPTQVASNISTRRDLELGVTPDLVVYTEAMAADQEEMAAAMALGVPMVNYFDALGMVANEYYLIAVAGAHGKTTTTAMLTDVLEEAGLDPTSSVGSLRSKTGSNFRAGKSKYAIVEACEYKRDFLSLKPDVLVITNIEWEHVDYFKDLADVQDTFHTLAIAVPEDGAIIAAANMPNLIPVLAGVSATVIDYQKSLDLGLKLRQPGLHNRQNAAAARAAAEFLGVETEVATTSLENFAGTWRRFEYKGDIVPVASLGGGLVPVYDDYAHHPTEIKMAILGARELHPDKKLTAVFQSHTYTRTHELFADFVSELVKADRVIMLPIYAAREVNVSGVTSQQLVAEINKAGTKALFFETIAMAALYVQETVVGGEMVMIMGAGPVTEVATELTK